MMEKKISIKFDETQAITVIYKLDFFFFFLLWKLLFSIILVTVN